MNAAETFAKLMRHINKPPGITKTFDFWANQGVGAGTGMKMLSAQAANEVLRHCRIGLVTKKASNG